MPYQLRFWHLCALLLFALVFAMPAYWHAPQAIAQTQAAPASAATAPPPTPTSVATPAPTPTDDELIGVAPATGWMRQLWARFGWWALPLALVALAGWVIVKLFEGVGEGIKEQGKDIVAQPLQHYNQQRQTRAQPTADAAALTTYLGWLKDELHDLPQIPLKQEQPELALQEVYVPLRVVERQQMDRFYAYLLGEHGAEGEYHARREAFDAIEQSQHVYRMLSDRDLLPARQPESRPRRRGEPTRLIPEEPLTERLLLVGDAGSGKTTTLFFGALLLAQDYLNENSLLARKELDLHTQDRLLPVYVRLTWVLSYLRDHYRGEFTRLDAAPAGRMLEFFDAFLPERVGQALPAKLFERRLRAGGCIVMLDGLDETGDEAERGYAKDLIANLVQACPHNRYIVASRPFDGVAQGLPGFLERRLSPMNEAEIDRLLHQWFGAASQGSHNVRRSLHIQQQIDDLSRRLNESPRLFDMATNPLLLTSMAILVYGGDPLPPVRAQIYYELTRLTINRWREAQLQTGRLNQHDTQPSQANQRVRLYADESNDEVRRRLQLLAAGMLRARRRELRLSEAQALLAPIYQRERGWSAAQSQDHVQALLYLLALHSGLIQERDQGYSFIHFTLQEYLTARDYDERDDMAGLAMLWDEPRWREALLLAVGHCATDGYPARAVQLIELLLAHQQPEALFLAAEALDEANARTATSLRSVWEQTIARLRALAFDPAACPDARMRNRAATLLDRLGADTRPELNPANAAYWAAPIAPGPFQMGPAPVWWNSNDKPESAFTAHIQRPYRLARFPVTNALYQQFLDALVANDTGPAAQEAYEQHRPHTWPGRSYRPGEGQHPVTGVTWHDAMAFAAWLDAQLRAAGVLAAGEQVRLPLETEWERAAAYPAAPPAANPAQGRRAYPWGAWPAAPALDNAALLSNLLQQADAAAAPAVPGPANTAELGIGTTSAVGIFPTGAAGCGAEDMAGNVWEWCASMASPYPLPADLAPETLDTQAIISLRGGSWYTDQTGVLGGARDVNDPHDRVDYVGLRVARAFSR